MDSALSTDFVQKVNREFEERAAAEMARKSGLEYVDIARYPINPDVLKYIPEVMAKESGVLPFDRNGRTLRVAIFSPQNPKIQEVEKFLESKNLEVKKFVCSQSGFAEAVLGYQAQVLQKKSVETRSTFEETQTAILKSKLKSLSELEKNLSKLKAEQILNEIELSAVNARASDIHFQPTENGSTLRLRIDGVLHPIFTIEKEIMQQLITLIKYQAGMRSNISDVPQDGAISFHANGRSIELRVSVLPTPWQESVVMRVLDSGRGIRTFSELGFSPSVEEKIMLALHQQNGIVLVTGPTGSGKTTTLYSMLAELNASERKLVTLEDPIEYHLPGVSQSQVNEDRNFNFENGFKSLLRHDPDVILVGEIRTLATAQLAFEAALTGHTVLSSLHTNSSTGAISRLRNMGVQSYNIAPSINAVFAQKLVRKINPTCLNSSSRESLKKLMEKNTKLSAAIERLQKVQPTLQIPEKIFVTAVSETKEEPYYGLTAICEAFTVTKSVREMILGGASEMRIFDYLRDETDFLTLFEDGLIKVLNGETTLEELIRVAGE